MGSTLPLASLLTLTPALHLRPRLLFPATRLFLAPDPVFVCRKTEGSISLANLLVIHLPPLCLFV